MKAKFLMGFIFSPQCIGESANFFGGNKCNRFFSLLFKSFPVFRKNAVTLIELLIAISLMGLVMLVASTFQLMMHRSSLSSEQQAALENQLLPTIDHITDNTKLFTTGDDGLGVIIDPDPVNPTDLLSGLSRRWFRGRIDKDGDGIGEDICPPPCPPPKNYSWYGYRFGSLATDINTLYFQTGTIWPGPPGSGWPGCGGATTCTPIAWNIVGLDLEQNPPESGFLIIYLTNRSDTTRPEGYRRINYNPQMTVTAGVYIRGSSSK